MKRARSELRDGCDQIFLGIGIILRKLAYSELLQDFFFGILSSFVYANMILNFFNNINEQTDSSSNSRRTMRVKQRYIDLRNRSQVFLSELRNDKKVDEKDYRFF